MISFGDYLYDYREDNKISLEELRDITGVSQPYLSQLENGTKQPSRNIIKRITNGISFNSNIDYDNLHSHLLELAGYSEIKTQNNKFGKKIRSIRQSRGLTLVELEKISKISNSYLSQIENGKFEPSNDILQKLSKGLDVPYLELMELAGYIEPEPTTVIFGDELKALRKSMNISMREAAKRSDISQPYLSQLETGKNKNPTPNILRKLSKGLNVPYNFLMGLAGYNTEPGEIKDIELNLLHLLNSDDVINYGDKTLTNNDKLKLIKMIELILD